MFEKEKNMWDVFKKLKNRGFREIELMMLCLKRVLVATLIGVALILIFKPSVGVCFWFTVVPWIYSMVRLFEVRRLVRFHLSGEVLEFLEAVSTRARQTAQAGAATENAPAEERGTGLLRNEYTDAYLSLISGILLVQTTLFLILPLYVNYSRGGSTVLLILAMISVVMLIVNATFYFRVWRTAATVAICGYLLGITLYLFPQISYYLGVEKMSRLIPSSSAEKVVAIDKLRNQQREQLNNAKLDQALRWQQEHQGQELPLEYQEVVEAAGKNLTVEEYRQIKAAGAAEVAPRKSSWFHKEEAPIKVSKKRGSRNIIAAKQSGEKPLLSGQVQYSHWDPKNLGAIRVANLSPGSYKISFEGVSQQWYDSFEKLIPVQPEGRIGVKLANQQELPVPSAPPGARLVKIGNGPWQFADREMKFKVGEPSDIFVTINARQQSPYNFTHNQGGDTVTIKRSA